MGHDFHYYVASSIEEKPTIDYIRDNCYWTDIRRLSRHNDIIGHMEDEEFTYPEVIQKIQEWASLLTSDNDKYDVNELLEAIRAFVKVCEEMSEESIAIINYC